MTKYGAFASYGNAFANAVDECYKKNSKNDQAGRQAFYSALKIAWDARRERLQTNASPIDFTAAKTAGKLPSAGTFQAILQCAEEFYYQAQNADMDHRKVKRYLNRIALTYRTGDAQHFWEYVAAFQDTAKDHWNALPQKLEKFEGVENDAVFVKLLENYRQKYQVEGKMPPLALPHLRPKDKDDTHGEHSYLGYLYRGSTLPPSQFQSVIEEVLAECASANPKALAAIDNLSGVYATQREKTYDQINALYDQQLGYDPKRAITFADAHNSNEDLEKQDAAWELREHLNKKSNNNYVSKEWVKQTGFDEVATQVWLSKQLDMVRDSLSRKAGDLFGYKAGDYPQNVITGIQGYVERHPQETPSFSTDRIHSYAKTLFCFTPIDIDRANKDFDFIRDACTALSRAYHPAPPPKENPLAYSHQVELYRSNPHRLFKMLWRDNSKFQDYNYPGLVTYLKRLDEYDALQKHNSLKNYTSNVNILEQRLASYVEMYEQMVTHYAPLSVRSQNKERAKERDQTLEAFEDDSRLDGTLESHGDAAAAALSPVVEAIGKQSAADDNAAAPLVAEKGQRSNAQLEIFEGLDSGGKLGNGTSDVNGVYSGAHAPQTKPAFEIQVPVVTELTQQQAAAKLNGLNSQFREVKSSVCSAIENAPSKTTLFNWLCNYKNKYKECMKALQVPTDTINMHVLSHALDEGTFGKSGRAKPDYDTIELMHGLLKLAIFKNSGLNGANLEIKTSTAQRVAEALLNGQAPEAEDIETMKFKGGWRPEKLGKAVRHYLECCEGIKAVTRQAQSTNRLETQADELQQG